MTHQHDASNTGTATETYGNITEKDYKPRYIEPVHIDDSDEIPRYDDYLGKAKMIIFSHFKYQLTKERAMKGIRYEDREGETTDLDSLKKTFTGFGFHVDPVRDPTVEMIKNKLDEVAAYEPTYKCIAIVVLTHGEGNVFAAYDEEYEEKMLLNYFKNKPQFKGIPKLFIFQVCRYIKDKELAKKTTSLVLEDDDMMVLHSTYTNQFANRHTKKGSWLIEVLCKRLQLMTKENLMVDEMLFVSRDVGIQFKGQQMPCLYNNMRKRFFLTPSIVYNN